MEELYNQFLEVVKSGDEAAAHAFLQAHLTEFPEDLQQKIVFAYFQEAVTDQAAQTENIQKAKQDGLELLKKLEAIRAEYTALKSA